MQRDAGIICVAAARVSAQRDQLRPSGKLRRVERVAMARLNAMRTTYERQRSPHYGDGNADGCRRAKVISKTKPVYS
jgi:hypothetical protein